MIICAHNSIAGGSVQVATSLIALYISKKDTFSAIKAIFVSSQVHQNLIELGIDSPSIVLIKRQNIFYRLLLDTCISIFYAKDSPIFYIFGPSYSLIPSSIVNQCVGVAEPWILFDPRKNPCIKHLPFYKYSQLYRLIKLPFFRNSCIFWTESEFASNCLLKLFKLDSPSLVFTINNFPNPIFSTPSLPSKPDMSLRHNVAVIGFPHVHKNIFSTLFILRDLLKVVSNITFNFTLPYDLDITDKFNKLALDLGVSQSVANHGFVSLTKCRELYIKSSISLHPSLLEVSSVSPLEATLCGCELVMPSLPFNKIYSQYAYLYDPSSSSNDIALIIQYILSLNTGSQSRSSKLIPLIKKSAAEWQSKHLNLFNVMNKL